MSSSRQVTRQARVLAAIRSRCSGNEDVEIDVGPLIPELGMPRRLVYAAVLALADAGLLEYRGAGPRVRMTAHGRHLAQESPTAR